MDYRHISIFKQAEEVKAEVISTNLVSKETGIHQSRESEPRKKRTYTTKQLIVPARYLLECLIQENQSIYPMLVSLLDSEGGVSRDISSWKELEMLSGWDSLNKSNLIYFRYRSGVLYMEFRKRGEFTVDKTLLPEVFHMSVLTRREVRMLWKELVRAAEREKRDYR